MPSKYQIISAMAAEQALDIISNAGKYTSFLTTAANNYKYSFREQLLIHAQKPTATACADVETWNKLGLWVNKGTKGIALLVDGNGPYRLRHVFDVSDTNSFSGRSVNLWRMESRFEDTVNEALENRFGELPQHGDFADDLMRYAAMVVEDNLPDYHEQMLKVKEDSFLEELDDYNVGVWLKDVLKSSVGYMLLTRCGYHASSYYNAEDFLRVYDFNTLDTVSVLGDAESAIAEMVLREIETTVKAVQREEKKQIRTFATFADLAYSEARKTETERRNENGTDLPDGGRLSAPKPDPPGEPEDREIWNAAAKLPAEEPQWDLHGDAAERHSEQPLGGSREPSLGDARNADDADGKGRERDGNPESIGSDDLGSADEQYPQPSGGDRDGGGRLQLSGHDFDARTDIPYYHYDEEKNELLRISYALKNHRVEIAAYFSDHEDRKERGNFIKSFFDNTFCEVILSNGQRAGYRAFDDLLTLWRGAYLSREQEVFMRWTSVADTIYGMILLEQWLAPGERPLPSVAEQMSFIEEAAKDDRFTLPQEAIDYVLAGGSSFNEGKFRIYEQFQKKAPQDENVAFLKKEYGVGGRSDAIPGSGYWEDHDAKGITITRNYGEGRNDKVLLKWSAVAKRIGELIEAERYLNAAEKAEYPAYQTREAERHERWEIAKEIKSIVYDFNDYKEQLGEKDRQLNQWVLSSAWSAFGTGEKTMHARVAAGEFIMPILREALSFIISEGTHLTPRCEAVLERLNTELALALEPTDEELNPPPEPKKEYRFALGDTVYLGTQEYEILSLGDETVCLYDEQFPLFNKELPREEFTRKVAENPLNNKYLHVVDLDEPEEELVETNIGKMPVAEYRDIAAQQAGFDDYEDMRDQGVKLGTQYDDDSLKPAENEAAEGTPVELAAPTVKPKGKTSSFLLHPEIPASERHDYRITDDNIGIGRPLDRYDHNIGAIKLLQLLEETDKLATPDQQSILAQYVGWGGLADCFDERDGRYEELKALLTPEEYDSARESTLTAFYTPPVVIRAMYQALENMGFKTGNILEPSCGVGNFIGMKPETLADSRVYGVELDSISGRIARQLYQNSSIAVQGYEKTDLPDSFFDVAVGNVPFGSFKVQDKRYDKFNFLIHDYFFARTLDKVRPGGIIAFITSKGTMDKENPSVRKYLAQRADLIGAIRLPNNTFKSAAGTEVTSDILFLQKRDRITSVEPGWVNLNTDENGIRMNQYFVDNPDMVLGEMREVSGPFGPETACIAYDDAALEEQLTAAIQNIHAQISEYEVEESVDEEKDLSIPADPAVRNFSYTLVDGTVYYRENSRMVPVELSATAESRIKGLMGIRDAVRDLIEYQTEDYPDDMIAAKQKELNERYDAFSKKYGIINSRANKSAFNADNSFCLLSSLEILDDDGNFVRKADMFSRRTIKQKVIVTSVDTASEALAVSLAEKAKVDMPFMMELTGKTEQEVFSDLRGVVFLNPMFGYGSSSEEKYLPADEYLSGNVREKLAWAKRSAEVSPEEYADNVAALQAVQPADLTAADISVRLGATWLPPEIIEEFMFELFNTPRYCQWNIHVHYSKFTGEWNIEGKAYDRSNVMVYNTYGTDRINGHKIIEQTLNLKDVRIVDYVEDAEGKKRPVLNKKETAIAQAKQELIKQAFADWIWEDPQRRDQLCRLYNDKFNSVRPREYDGSHLTLVGINPEITLRPHQLNAVARGLYGGNELLGHVVGAGKTYTMVAIAQESKRLGLCQKSMIVVPNHLTEQWAAEYLQLYPAANILVVTAKDFEAKNRKRFCGRIATGDYDAIIIGHSQLEKIPLSVERQQVFLEQQMDEIMEGIAELKANKGDRFSVKQMERSKKQVQIKLDKLNDQSNKDDLVTFEELGIDKLFIDEAHYYKNLAAFTKMRNVGGISQTEAMKSSDLYMKCRYLDELTGGKGVVFATGTPISNTMVELYTMQKYLQYDTLRQNDLLHFDSWASTFGETVTAIELAPEGTGYRAKTRFAKFYNLPELMAMFKETADIQTADMLNLPVPKANYHNIVLQPSEHQRGMVEELAKRAERVRSGMVNSSVDNMLVITNDGRKLALDQRLINEMLPDSETGKVSACADNVFEIWQRTSDQRSTQMVFCDLSTPHNDGHFNVYDALRDKLIAKGIPAEEIEYIHSAGTEVKKKELFGKVRSGQIRVLIGSTQKMGAGTNVQKKLIALHHLDCPWRPADLQQREGRIIRQGNENPEVEIYTYVTENTFDSYLYQLVETKQKFIGQIMTSKSPVRSAEDVDETALSYAEIKALCAGNPFIKEKMDLDIAVQKLKLVKASYLSQKYSLEDKIIKDFPQQIASLEQRITGFQTDIRHRDENSSPNEDGFCSMVIEGMTFTDKKAAGSAIIEACHNMSSPDAIPLGTYRGFSMDLSFDIVSREYKITMKNQLRHTVPLGTDIFGNILRLDNALSAFEERLTACKEQLANTHTQLANAKEQIEKPFPQEEELKEKTARLDELNILLNMDKAQNELVDEERDDEEPDGRSAKEMEVER